jgi:hypothetical protein
MKYFAQTLGHEGMSTPWCMYCQIYPYDWKGLFSVPYDELWGISKKSHFFQEISAGQLKEPKDKKGIVSEPIVDFIEPKDSIFPQLHFEIGALQTFVEEQIEEFS